MAHPSDKISRSKRGMRRSHHALVKPTPANCPNCGALTRPHRACGDCGHYKGKEVLAPRN